MLRGGELGCVAIGHMQHPAPDLSEAQQVRRPDGLVRAILIGLPTRQQGRQQGAPRSRVVGVGGHEGRRNLSQEHARAGIGDTVSLPAEGGTRRACLFSSGAAAFSSTAAALFWRFSSSRSCRCSSAAAFLCAFLYALDASFWASASAPFPAAALLARTGGLATPFTDDRPPATARAAREARTGLAAADAGREVALARLETAGARADAGPLRFGARTGSAGTESGASASRFDGRLTRGSRAACAPAGAPGTASRAFRGIATPLRRRKYHPLSAHLG